MHAILATAAACVLAICYQLRNDSKIRKVMYSDPLTAIPDNAFALIDEMIAEATKDSNLTPTQIEQIIAGIYAMLSEGAVAERNLLMEKTRESISKLGVFLSWFMKQEGLSYNQIKAKYANSFTISEIEVHKKIIQSASRANHDLLSKFYNTLKKKTFSGGWAGPRPKL